MVQGEIFQTTHYIETKERESNQFLDFVIFDADSTLSTIEGIDELARMKGVDSETVELTRRAMNGEIPFDEVYFRRFDIIQPTWKDVIRLGYQYKENITPGAVETIAILMENNIQPVVVSGGFNPALRMLTNAVGIPNQYVFANEIFNSQGTLDLYQYTRFQLWRPKGKIHLAKYLQREFSRSLHRKPRFAVVGDGISDFEAGQLADLFVCFAGVEARPKVMDEAENVVVQRDLRYVLPYLL